MKSYNEVINNIAEKSAEKKYHLMLGGSYTYYGFGVNEIALVLSDVYDDDVLDAAKIADQFMDLEDKYFDILTK